MPIKSKAQRRKFAELLVEGSAAFSAIVAIRAAGKAELPERLHPKAKAKSKRKVKAKRAAKAKSASAKNVSRSRRKRD